MELKILSIHERQYAVEARQVHQCAIVKCRDAYSAVKCIGLTHVVHMFWQSVH